MCYTHGQMQGPVKTLAQMDSTEERNDRPDEVQTRWPTLQEFIACIYDHGA